MRDTATATRRGWRTIERYVYVERPYEDTWTWLAGHLSTLGVPLPGGGRSFDLRIRPAGNEVVRPVRLHVAGMVCREDHARAGLEWTDAAHPHLFPRLEGTLRIAPVPSDGGPFTEIGIQARYRPPLGPLGAVGDRLVGAGITDVALTTFLDDLADAVDNQVPAPSLEPPLGAPDRQDDDPAIRRILLTVEGLAIRHGGGTGACAALEALDGVAHVSLNPFSELVAVDLDPAVCTTDDLMAALDDDATG
jgi:hypothetical protein